MSSICSSLGPLVAQWRHRNASFLIFLHSKTKIGFVSSIVCCSNNDSLSKHSQLGHDPSEDFLGIDADLKLRNVNSSASNNPKSWFGPNGLYIKELPCPSCRGRGYTPCTECGIERSRLDCFKCTGKGMITCHQCLGDCVIWEESIDEQPWEKARSISPLKMKEDDEVDNLEIQLDKKKSKRVYQSPSPEVGQKISRALKSLNAKTGLFSKRMKIIHSNPVLHAQRVAAIKKAKGTAAARKHTSETLKAFFSDPENRHKRSLSMKGVKFFCKNCGREGHRKHYCPELKEDSLDRRFRCRLCGEKGHNKRTCPKSRISTDESTDKRRYHCKVCHRRGHNRRTCPKRTGSELVGSNTIKKSRLISKRRIYTCLLCREKGHNARTCPNRKEPATVSVGYEKETDGPAME
ncbi:zinc knuckle (CCHC-type) family protein [Euphorbia peplus]|nr:zinc knuckle (CCHC-type) family protein [Euphorbia peplus]